MLPAGSYDRPSDAGWPDCRTDARFPKLVHIIGYPSSGTTLLRRILNAHPDLCITSEMPLLPTLAGKLPARIDRTNFRETKRRFLAVDVYGNFRNRELLYPDLVTLFGPAEYYTAAHLYAALIDPRPCTYYGNKTPQYSESLPKLLALFPQTKLILIVRDIRAWPFPSRQDGERARFFAPTSGIGEWTWRWPRWVSCRLGNRTWSDMRIWSVNLRKQ